MASYTLSPIGGAGSQFFDNNGNPLVGGLLYTYAAGTTTPQETWTTPAGTTENSNPIILNAAGRPSQEIWLSVAYSYKFVIKDSNGVLIATYDNIPGLPQPAIVNDASSISYEQGNIVNAGSFVVGNTYMIASVGTTNFVSIGAAYNSTGQIFIATGVGSGTGTAYNSQTVESKLQQTVSVKDFGAVGDGVTDDTAAIQAAIAACSAIVDGTLRGTNTLYFPSGTYLCGSQIGNMPCSCIGENRITTIIKYTGSAAPFISFGDASYSGLHFRYANASLTGNFTEEQFPGIFIDCFWSGNSGSSALTTAECCISVNKALQVEFDKCHFTDAKHGVLGQTNPLVDGFANGITISNCIFGNYLYGAIKNGGQAWTIQGCIFEFNPSNEVQAIITDGDSNWYGAMVTGCWFGDYTALTSTPYIQWKGNGLSVVGNYINGSGSNAPIFMEISGNSRGVSITGNYISNFDQILDAGAYTIQDLFIFGNRINAVTTALVGTPTGSYIIKDYDGTDYTAMGRTVFSNLSVGATTNKTASNIVATNTAIDGGNLTAQQYIASTQALASGVGGGIALGGVYNSAGANTFGGGITVGKENATDGEYGFHTYLWSRANGSPGNAWFAVDSTGNSRPTTDGTKSSGTAAYRWSEVFAAAPAINTSDANEKQQIRIIEDAERAVAVKLKGLIKAFKFNDSVKLKGNGARVHFGVIAQEVKKAFESENLDAHAYGLFCYDEWDKKDGVVNPDGTVIDAVQAGSRYGIRYEELFAFIIASM